MPNLAKQMLEALIYRRDLFRKWPLVAVLRKGIGRRGARHKAWWTSQVIVHRAKTVAWMVRWSNQVDGLNQLNH